MSTSLAPVSVTLSPEHIHDAEEMARATYERWRGYSGHYRNLYSSHLRGKLGEIAVEVWAKAQEIDPIAPLFRDPRRERDADLVLGATNIEVKTWDSTGWAAWGRCVAPTQVPSLRRKTDIVFWCYLTGVGAGDQAVLAGWSTLDEITAHEPRSTGPSYHPVLNHQVPLEKVHPMNELLDRLQRVE